MKKFMLYISHFDYIHKEIVNEKIIIETTTEDNAIDMFNASNYPNGNSYKILFIEEIEDEYTDNDEI